MGEVLRKFSKNQVMVYGSVSFQSSISTYRSVTFQLSVKLPIYGSVSEAGEFGPSHTVKVDAFTF